MKININVAHLFDKAIDEGMRAGLKRCYDNKIEDEERCMSIIHDEILSKVLDLVEPDDED